MMQVYLQGQNYFLKKFSHFRSAMVVLMYKTTFPQEYGRLEQLHSGSVSPTSALMTSRAAGHGSRIWWVRAWIWNSEHGESLHSIGNQHFQNH